MNKAYTVVGWWVDSNERYVEAFDAPTARDAEEAMLEQARDEAGTFRIAGTLLGQIEAADTYTAFVDPDDPENEAREDLEPAVDELGMTEWTVLGLVTSTRHGDHDWNEETGGQRHHTVEMALNPRIAEDLARMAVRERGAVDLTVCAVVAGRVHRCESFQFADHDQKAAA
jgi:hypothetical protein